MARRRKSRGLSGTVDGHAARALKAIEEAEDNVEAASAAYNNGDCLTAGQKIDRAYVLLGKAEGHGEGCGDYDTRWVDRHKRVSKYLERVDDKFEKKCVRKRPEP